MAAAVIALIPLVYLVIEAFSRGAANVWDEIFRARTWDLVRNSFLLTAVVTAASVVLGTGGAWVTTRFSLPGRTLLLVLLTLPLAIPSYLSAFAWISWQPQLAGFWGAAIVLTFACFPYVLLPVSAALRGLDPAQEEVARSLGKTPREIAGDLVLRQVRPSITAGAKEHAIITFELERFAILPPAEGWQLPIHGVCGDIIPGVDAAIAEYRRRAASVVDPQALAEQIWERPSFGGLPLRVLHAARRLGFVTDDGSRMTACTMTGWKRLTTVRGQVFVRTQTPTQRPDLSVVR